LRIVIYATLTLRSTTKGGKTKIFAPC